MSYLLLHRGALASVHGDERVIPAGDVAHVRSAVALLAEAEAVHANAVGAAERAREDARSSGYAEGLAQARAAAREEYEARLAELTERAAAEHARLRAQAGSLALGVIRHLAGELGPEPVVAGLAEAALDRLMPEPPVLVRVAPATASCVSERLSGRHGVRVLPDPALDSFDCVLETGEGRANAGLETQLAALERAWARHV